MRRQQNNAAEWNVVALAEPRATAEVLRLLRAYGAFRTTRYPRVIVGRAVRAAGLLEDLGAGCPISRIIPLERSLRFARDDVTETLCECFEEMGPRLAGKSFFVRARLRGLKGRLEHPVVERALGSFLYDRACQAGAPAEVSFSDPDIVVAVEVVAERVGYAFLDRELRRAPLLKIR